MIYTISQVEVAPDVDFAPSGVPHEVVQNIRTLLKTEKFSVPFDRDFGLSHTILDAPLPRAMALVRVEVWEATRKYEPRAKVLRVYFEHRGPENGELYPAVEVSIDEK